MSAFTTNEKSDDEPSPPPRGAVGLRLRAARLEAGLTQDQLASQVGRKKNWLSDIERGRRGIDVQTLQRIADLTGHSIEFFTNPGFSQKRREEMLRPVTREDWELIYADEPERAAAHASLDEAFRRARQTLASVAPLAANPSGANPSGPDAPAGEAR